MAFDTLGTQNQQTRDEIGSEPTVHEVVKIRTESIGVVEGPRIAKSWNLGNAWIVGTSTNGLVGPNTGTIGGGQQVVGGDGRVTTILNVINPGQRFYENFRFDELKDSAQPNTAYWDTSSGLLRMTSATTKTKVYNTVAISKSIALNDGTITHATISATEHKWGNDTIRYYLSANGGGTWKEFKLNTDTMFEVAGTNLKFKIMFIGNGANETYLTDFRVYYG